jgi:hypothetical protein
VLLEEPSMNQKLSRTFATLALSLGAALALAPAAYAQKPDWAGQGGGKGNASGNGAGKEDVRPSKAQATGDSRSGDTRISIQIGAYFDDRQRRSALDYYRPVFSAGQCPPGLAKKNNGCMPPGLAKQWARGRPLPGGIITYPIPRDLEIRLGIPPAGHKYVRIAADILLIAVGTSMVVDAIEDLASL